MTSLTSSIPQLNKAIIANVTTPCPTKQWDTPECHHKALFFHYDRSGDFSAYTYMFSLLLSIVLTYYIHLITPGTRSFFDNNLFTSACTGTQSPEHIDNSLETSNESSKYSFASATICIFLTIFFHFLAALSTQALNWCSAGVLDLWWLWIPYAFVCIWSTVGLLFWLILLRNLCTGEIKRLSTRESILVDVLKMLAASPLLIIAGTIYGMFKVVEKAGNMRAS